jgi:toxin FitB
LNDLALRMVLLDTNVVSEAMTREPHPRVRAWLDAQVDETLFLSSITVAELLLGIGALPAGKRKDALAGALDDVLDLFAARILPFDTSAARHYADLAVKAGAAGKGSPTPDGYIAAIAAAHGFVVASRDTSAFNAAGLTVIDPWTVTG